MAARPTFHVLVMAKAPVAGRVKTRLTPPFTPDEAAEVAQASLEDTLDSVSGCGATNRIVALDGEPGSWLPDGFDVVAQRGATFNERLEHAWAYAGGPGIQIGMDTPQVSAALLDASARQLLDGPDGAVLGLADDGGWWAIGLRRLVRGVFDDVPMSEPDTGQRQLARLKTLGLSVGLLASLRDIDVATDLAAVVETNPHLRVAHTAAGRSAMLH